MTTPLFRLASLSDQIIVCLNNRLQPRGSRAIEGFVGMGDDIDRLPDGTPQPMAILQMGQPGTARSGSQGASITGARNSMRLFSFSTLLIAPDDSMLSILYDQVAEALVGTVFPGCGEVREVQGAPRAPVPKLYAPARFAMSAGFAMSIGA